MPGIFGLAGQVSDIELSSCLTDMADRMMHHDWYGRDRFIDPVGRVALGQVTLDTQGSRRQIFCTDDGHQVAVVAGEIYDSARQRRRLEESGQQFQTSSYGELLIHGLARYGPAFFAELHGKFAAAVWNASTGKLLLVNDRFGMKPMYYAHSNGRLVFGSEIKTLLTDPAISRKCQLRGVAQFFTFGQLLAEDTLFDGIHLLPAAGVLTYDLETDRVTIDRHWRIRAQVNAGQSTAEALDRIDHAFAASVQRMTVDAKGLGLSLSGGLDARTLLGVFGSGKQLTTLSLGMAGSMDHRSAAEMARLLGYPHRQVVLDEQFLTDFEGHLRHMVRLTDGQYLCQCIVMPTLPIYRDLGVRTLLRGHAGELMHMTKAYNFSVNDQALAIKCESELFDWLWLRLQAFMLDGTDGRLFAPQHREAIEGLARESLMECVRRTRDTEPVPHRIWRLFFEQRTRRETALSLVEFDSVVETRLPYLDNELVEELFSTPPTLKLGETIQAEILRRRCPEFLNVVNVNTGTKVGASRLIRSIANFRKRVFAKLGVPGYQPYERLGLWLRRDLQPLVRRILLSEQCLSRGLFDPQAVRAVVDDHMHARKNHTYLLLALLVYEVGQQELVDQQTNVPEPVEAA
jgi:asparagine synthase (glutamine-hydrolysing)